MEKKYSGGPELLLGMEEQSFQRHRKTGKDARHEDPILCLVRVVEGVS